MSTFRKLNLLFSFLLIFIVFSLLIFLALQKIHCLDVWGHLAFGKYIVKNHSLPTHEAFSYTAKGKTFYDFYWFYQILFYFLYILGKIPALIIAKTIILFFTFFLVFLFGYRKVPLYVWLIIIVAVILSAEKRFFVRPQIFTFSFLAVYLFFLIKYSEENKKWIYFLPIVQIFWANIHTISLLGPIILVVFSMGEVMANKITLPFKWKENKLFSLTQCRTIFLIAIICLIVSLFNPYGYKIFTHNLNLFQTLQSHQNILPCGIKELNSISFNTYHLFSKNWMYFKILVLLSFISIFLNIKRQNISTLIIFLAFLYFAKRVNRGVGVFSIFASFMIYQNSKMIVLNYSKKFRERIKFPIILGINLILILGIIFGSFYGFKKVWKLESYYNGRIVKRAGFGTIPFYPTKAVNFIKKNNLKGNMFNSLEFGHYLIWQLYPERKVFIDGRLELYREDILRFYGHSLKFNKFIEKVIHKFDINYFIISTAYNKRLDKYLYHSNNWKLVYFSPLALIFVKDIPQNKKIIKEHKINLQNWVNKLKHLKEINDEYYNRVKPESISLINEAIFFKAINKITPAELALKESLRLNSDISFLYLSLSSIYMDAGEYRKAVSVLNKAIYRGLRSKSIYGRIGAAYEKLGQKKKAIRFYKKAVSPWGGKPSSVAFRNLARYYYNEGLYSKGLRYINKAINLKPNDYLNYYIKGTIYLSMGLYNRAKKFLEKSITFNPSFAKGYNNLGFCYYKLGLKDSAVKMLEKAVELDKNMKSAKKMLQKIK